MCQLQKPQQEGNTEMNEDRNVNINIPKEVPLTCPPSPLTEILFNIIIIVHDRPILHCYASIYNYRIEHTFFGG